MGNKNWIYAAIILVIAGLVALFYFDQEEPVTTDLKTQCCQECLEAFSQSPVAIDKAGAVCGDFTTGQPISEECLEYFRNNPTTVAECE